MIWLMALTLATAPPPARGAPPPMSGFFDETQLVAACRPADRGDLALQGLCLGYVLGVVDHDLIQEARRPPGRKRFCLPTDLTAEEVRAQVAARLVPPGRPGLAAATVIRRMLEQEFPCRSSIP